MVGNDKLPEGWAETTLDDVVILRNEKIEPSTIESVPYISLAHIESDTNRITNHGLSADVKSLKSVFRSGDVLYGKLRPYLNKVYQPDFSGVCSTDILVFKQSQAIDNRFLLHLLSRKETVEYAKINSKGINLPRVSPHKLGELPVNLPPLKEQKRIIAKIEELHVHSRRVREALETVPDLLDQLRQSILSAAFRGDLSRKWREQNPDAEPATELLNRIRIERRKRWEAAELEKLKAKGLTGDKLDTQFAKRRKQYKEPEQLDTNALPELPKGWCWVSWDMLTSLITSGSRGWADYYSSEGSFFIRAQDIKTDELLLNDIAHVLLPENSEGLRTLVKKDDLLVTITGANVTKTAIVREHLDEAYVSQHVGLVRPIEERVSPLMHLWAISNVGGRGILLEASYGGGKPGLNLENLRRLKMPLPNEKEIGKITEIVMSHLKWIHKLQAIYKDLYQKIDILDQSILSKAFCGELVPQDPNEEPASALMERIRKEKAKQAAEQKIKPTQRGKKMKSQKIKQQDILTILQESARLMTPEELFTTGGFGEDSVDAFYEQLRSVVSTKKILETRKGGVVRLEAAS